MSYTLTFFKKVGSEPCDCFFGTFAGPDDPPGQWDFITRDQELKDAGIVCELVNYSDVNTLTEIYKRKVNRAPYFDLRRGDNSRDSIAYPGKSPLSYPNIKAWALDFVKVNNSKRSAINPSNTESSTSSTTTPTSSITPNNTSRNWIAPLAIGGGLFVAACAVVATGNLFGRREENIESDKILLVDDNDDPIKDFNKWDQEQKTSLPAQEISNSLFTSFFNTPTSDEVKPVEKPIIDQQIESDSLF